MAGVSARGWACGPCPHPWADPPIQNRRIRRCGDGLEPVPLQHSSPVRIVGSEPGPRCLSQPWAPSPHHVGVGACALPPMLQGCGVAQRQPGGRRHDRALIHQGAQSRERRTLATRPPQVRAVRRRLQGVAGVWQLCQKLNGLGVHTQAWREGQRWYDRRLTCEGSLP
jgi:hypothetical protein